MLPQSSAVRSSKFCVPSSKGMVVGFLTLSFLLWGVQLHPVGFVQGFLYVQSAIGDSLMFAKLCLSRPQPRSTTRGTNEIVRNRPLRKYTSIHIGIDKRRERENRKAHNSPSPH